jgi:thermostable 8-oxoguanine DNA glycosylase
MGETDAPEGDAVQVMYAVFDGIVSELRIPPPDAPVLPRIPWGAFDDLLTPAYWKGQAWQHEHFGTYRNLRLGGTLLEEVTACLLGGYGMKAELGLAAFGRLREHGLLTPKTSAATLEKALATPFLLQGQLRRYRFPAQKAKYLGAFLAEVERFVEPDNDLQLRDGLAELPGIGLKTASWVVRNYRRSNAVAIIDIHVLRAGRHIGLFQADWIPQRHYAFLEEAFLRFSDALGVEAGILDGLIWDYMRRMPTKQGGSKSHRRNFGQLLLPFLSS